MITYQLKKNIKKLLAFFNIGISTKRNLDKLRGFEQPAFDLELIKSLNKNHASKILPLLEISKSQLRQDLFVLSQLDFKKDGYFVEFGACDGVILSNTYLLEKRFGWKGIIAEPARIYHPRLSKNRSCHFEYDCIWSKTGEQLEFQQVDIEPELSTLKSYSANDHHYKTRRSGRNYLVKTISLLDLLKKYNAPKHIDYLSIDTEGSEFEILNAFDFEKYEISVITCEHNFNSYRSNIHDLLVSKGFKRVLESISQFEDWYVRI